MKLDLLFSLSLFSFPRGRPRLFCLKLLSKIKSKSYSSAYLQYRNDDDVHCSNISWHFLLFIQWIELYEHWTLSKNVKRLHFLSPDANKEFVLKPNEFLYTLSFLKSFSMRHFHIIYWQMSKFSGFLSHCLVFAIATIQLQTIVIVRA